MNESQRLLERVEMKNFGVKIHDRAHSSLEAKQTAMIP